VLFTFSKPKKNGLKDEILAAMQLNIIAYDILYNMIFTKVDIIHVLATSQ